jgi:DNA-binding LytR/AlgR family response regulator
MKVLIIEDEYPAAERLEKMLYKVGEPFELLHTLDSVSVALKWFEKNQAPDLIFSDIQLSDGLCFEIYDKVTIHSPIIFTTSYDEYAIRAFKVKSIDYLLKPIKFEELAQAIKKFQNLKSDFSISDHSLKIEQLLDSLHHTGKQYKKRFLVKSGEQLIPVSDNEIAYFYTARELVYLIHNNGKKYVVDYTLEQVEQLTDPGNFFRINRQFILNLTAMRKIHTYFNGRLKLEIEPACKEDVLVSKSKVKDFKNWMEGIF